jgi:cholesterol oxidase
VLLVERELQEAVAARHDPAERHGAPVAPMTTVDSVAARPDGTFTVDMHRTGSRSRKHRGRVTADRRRSPRRQRRGPLGARWSATETSASCSVGRLGRVDADQLGEHHRGRSHQDRSRAGPHTGVAVSSSFYADENTHIQPVRYGRAATP